MVNEDGAVVRAATRADVAALADLWHEGWQDAHAAILPAELAHWRTRESFRERLAADLAATRVIGLAGAPLGFSITHGDELNQLFVARTARGSGIAATLVADAEAGLATRGVRVAWLACAIGNQRAARFYERCGWRRAGTMVSRLQVPTGPFDLEVWRYEKRLAPPGS
ncbi:GNAT family N-acetyltransferase [Dokdonella sp.]|uniref:GNAT family N-acetyltransferase n=1 Tax=Dokdonella sp. TaxID=2291710 RepID=UPI002F4215D6